LHEGWKTAGSMRTVSSQTENALAIEMPESLAS
jgi:hypothetical protein